MNKRRLSQSEQIALWQRIRNYDFEGVVKPSFLERVSDMFSDVSPHMHAFAHKLSQTSFFKERASKNPASWDKKFAERVINQYKRFCFLAVVCDHPVTPSLAVDECWHVHLMHTRQYSKFRDEILQFDLDHEPGFDLDEEQLQFDEQYLLTLDAYKFHFGEEAPQDIWPHHIVRKRYQQSKNEEYSSSYSSGNSSDTPFIHIWVDDNHGSIHSADHHDGFGGYSGGNYGGAGTSGSWNDSTPSHSTHSSVDSTHSDGGGHSDGGSHGDSGGGDSGGGDSGGGSSCGSSCGGGCGGG